MDQEDLYLVRRREFGELLHFLTDSESRGVLLFGDPGTGKTTLLHMVEEELNNQGRAVFFVNVGNLRYPGDLGAMIFDAMAASPFREADDVRRTIRSSKGDVSLQETIEILHYTGVRLESPTILFDALDESLSPPRMASAIEQLSISLNDWKFVVASRPAAIVEIRRFARFGVIELRGITEEDTVVLVAIQPE